MKIKVLGTGCPKCKKLYNDVKELVEELKLDAEVEKIDDIQQIMAYGIMSVPALIVNGNVKFAGKSPNKEDLRKYLFGDCKSDTKCSCNNNCGC